MAAKIRQAALRGIKWNMISRLWTNGLRLILLAILSRLIDPDEFGLIGMIMVFTGFVTIFSDMGLSSALIQKKVLEPGDRSTVFWLNFAIGLLLFSAMFFAAPLIADFYEEARLTRLTRWLSLIFVISSFNIVQLALLVREMDFRRIFFVTGGAELVGGLFAVFLAFQGFEARSLVAQALMTAGVTSIALWWWSAWRPRRVFSTASLKEIGKFSVPLWAGSSINYWVRNIDNLLIGKYLGKNALGLYGQAYRIMLIPVREFGGQISKVLFPSLAKIQDEDERIRAIFLKVIQIMAFIFWPALTGLLVLSNPTIQIVLGEKWLAMTPALRWLCVVGMLQCLNTLTANIYLAKGKTKLQFYLILPSRLWTIAAIVYGLRGGIEGVAFYYMLAVVANTVFIQYFAGRIIQLSLLEIGRVLFPIGLCSAIMGGSLYLLRGGWSHASDHLLGWLGWIFLGVGIFALTSWLFCRPIILLLWKEAGNTAISNRFKKYTGRR